MTIKLATDGSLVAADLVDGEAVVAEIAVGEIALPAPKRKGGRDNNYPFITKAEILGRIADDGNFVKEAIFVLYEAQTLSEQEKKTTESKNRVGFMSSHAVNGTKLAEKLLLGEEWTAEESDKARSIASRYGRQLAAHYRAKQVAESPELAEKAACFFTN